MTNTEQMQSSRTGTIDQDGTFDLDSSSGDASLAMGGFTAPATGTFLLVGNIHMSWVPDGGSGDGSLGYIVGDVTAGGNAAVSNTGAREPAMHAGPNPGGGFEADWMVAGTVAATQGEDVSLTFRVQGHPVPQNGIHYQSTLAYCCA